MVSILIIITLTLCVFLSPVNSSDNVTGNQTSGCDPGWKQHNKSCFMVVPTKQTWDMAQELCRSSVFGGQLAEISTPDLTLFLDLYLGKTYENAFATEFFWLGASDAQLDGHWVWSTSNTTLISPLWWDQATPVGNPLFNCLAVGKITLNKFKDEKCSNKHFFICEKSVTEVSTTTLPTAQISFGGNQHQHTPSPDIDTNHELPVFVG